MYGKNPNRPFKVLICYIDPDTEYVMVDYEIYPSRTSMEEHVKRIHNDWETALEKQQAIKEMYNIENTLDRP